MEKSTEKSKSGSIPQSFFKGDSQPYPTNETEVLVSQPMPQSNPNNIPGLNPQYHQIPPQYHQIPPQYNNGAQIYQYPQNYPYPPQNPEYPVGTVYPQHEIIQINNIIVPAVILPSNLQPIISLGRKARIACYIHSCLDALLMYSLEALIVLVLIGLIGMQSTLRFSRNLGITYIVLLYLVILLKLALIGINLHPAIIGIFSFLIVMSIVVSVFFIKFVKKLQTISESEVELCKGHLSTQRCRFL